MEKSIILHSNKRSGQYRLTWKTILSSILTVSLLLSVFPMFGASVMADGTMPFTDVKSGKWYYEAIKRVYDEGIMNGLSDKIFAPSENMTRAQLVTIICRISGDAYEGLGENLTFSDTKSDAWYSDYVGWAVKDSIVAGYPEGKFKPNAQVTRAELAVVFARFFTSRELYFAEAPLTDSFTDIDKIASWAKESVETIRLYGIIAGDNEGKFNPSSSATRAEIATMITRYLDAERISKVEYLMSNLYDYLPTQKNMITFDFYYSNTLTTEGFSSRMFPYLGISEEDYELIANDSELGQLKGNWQTIVDLGEQYPALLTLALKDKVTGETSKKRLVRFLLTKTEIHRYIDPDDFDPGIDEDIYNEMYSIATANTGNTARLYAALEKGISEDELTVAFIGGSITQGAVADGDSCYAAITANWLGRHITDNLTYINNGIGGTSSALACARVQRQVLDKDPDIVFVEYAVNDGSQQPIIQETFESLVRTLLLSECEPAVVFIYSYYGDASIPFMDKVAEKYQIPVINTHAAVSYAIEQNVFTEEEFCEDHVHPNEYGHQIMSDMNEEMMRIAMESWTSTEEAEAAFVSVPEDSITSVRFEDLNIIDTNDLDIVSLGSFVLDTGSSFEGFDHPATSDGTNGNEPLVFTVTGKTILILVNQERLVDISVDGGEYYKLGTLISSWVIPAVLSDTEQTHTISIRSNDPSTPITVLAVLYK